MNRIHTKSWQFFLPEAFILAFLFLICICGKVLFLHSASMGNLLENANPVPFCSSTPFCCAQQAATTECTSETFYYIISTLVAFPSVNTLLALRCLRVLDLTLIALNHEVSQVDFFNDSTTASAQTSVDP